MAPMDTDLDQHLGQLLAEGEPHSQGFFSLNTSRMTELLSKYRLPRPHQFLLKLVQWAVASGAGTIDLELQPAGLRLRHDGRSPTEQELGQLLDPTQQAERHLTHLSIGLVTALDFKPARLVLAAGDCQLLLQGASVSKPEIRLRTGHRPEIYHDPLDQEHLRPPRDWVSLCLELAAPEGNLLTRSLRKLAGRGQWVNSLRKELEACRYCPVPLRLTCDASSRRVDESWLPPGCTGIYLVDRKGRPGLWRIPRKLLERSIFTKQQFDEICWIGDGLLSNDDWAPLVEELNLHMAANFRLPPPLWTQFGPETCLAVGWQLGDQPTSCVSLVLDGVVLEDFRSPRLENRLAVRCLASCHELRTEISSLKLVHDDSTWELIGRVIGLCSIGH